MGLCIYSTFCCALLCIHSSFCNLLDEGNRAGCFALFFFLVSHDCTVALPHNATGTNFLFIVTPIVGKRELAALLNLSSWFLVMVERLFLVVPRGCLRFVIMVFPDHTH